MNRERIAEWVRGIEVLAAKIRAELGDERHRILERFIAERCHDVPGSRVLFTDFYRQYDRWLVEQPDSAQGEWAKLQLIPLLPARFPYGRMAQNKRYVGNLSW